MWRIGKVLSRTVMPGQSGSKIVSELPSPKCPYCQNQGVVHPRLLSGKPDFSQVKACTCRAPEIKARREKHLLKFCCLPVGTETMTLDTFRAPLEYPSLILALSLARQMAAGDEKMRCLTLVGDVDRGKTRLAIGICLEWLRRGQPARYSLVSLLLKELRDGFELEGELSYRLSFDRLLKLPLLVMDDIGIESPSTWALEQIQTIVDYRYLNGLHTVVTTNRPMDDLFHAEDDRTRRDRLYEASRRLASRLQRESWGAKVMVIGSPEYRIWSKKVN